MDVEQDGTDERFVAILYGKGIVGKGVQAIRGGFLIIEITGQCAESGNGEGDVVFGGDLPAEIDFFYNFRLKCIVVFTVHITLSLSFNSK